MEPTKTIENEIYNIDKINKLKILVINIDPRTPKEQVNINTKDINPSPALIYKKLNELENSINNLNKRIKELEDNNREKEKMIDNLNERIKFFC